MLARTHQPFRTCRTCKHAPRGLPTRQENPSDPVKETPDPGGAGNAPRFPARPEATFPQDWLPQAQRRPAPDPAGAKRPPGAGRALAGGFGPRRAWDQRGAVAGAMAPAMATALAVRIQIVRALFGREQETHAFPPPAPNAATKTGSARTNGRPAPGPAGEKRPPWAGRALAGGFGPRLAKDRRGTVAGAMAPAIEAVNVLWSVRAGPRNAPRSPARARRCPVDRQVQAH